MTGPRGWALGAALWAMLFAVPSFYWAFGGDTGTETVAADVEGSLGWAADPAVLALTGIGKLLLALLALSYGVLDLGLRRRWHLNAGRAIAAGMVAYGALSLADHALMLSGVRPTPAVLGETAVWWHALVWDPYWLLGGVLLALAVRQFGSRQP